MKITVVGGGYVGLVTAAGLATFGHHVICIENNKDKLRKLQDKQIPIYEPGLDELINTVITNKRLSFTDELQACVPSDFIFLAVGTPSLDDGSADMTAYNSVLESLVPLIQSRHIVVTKSTVPIGTAARVQKFFQDKLNKTIHIVSNPEFLREGNAVADFMKPDRVVIGSYDSSVAAKVRLLYEPLENVSQFICTDPTTSEFIKYASNSMLATRISFMNEMALLSEKVGADIDTVRRGIGTDSRIGPQYLYPGPGFGGSCFSKDLMALSCISGQYDSPKRMIDATLQANEHQKHVLFKKVSGALWSSTLSKTVCIWGLAFKARTDDIRDSPAIFLIDDLLKAGVRVQVHDPKAIPNVRAVYGDKLHYYDNMYHALAGSEILVIATEWRDYLAPDFEQLRAISPNLTVVDGRNIWHANEVLEAGFNYTRIGMGMMCSCKDSTCR